MPHDRDDAAGRLDDQISQKGFTIGITFMVLLMWIGIGTVWVWPGG